MNPPNTAKQETETASTSSAPKQEFEAAATPSESKEKKKRKALPPLVGAKPYLSVDEAAQEIGVTRRFLETRINDHEIAVFKPSARLVRIRRVDLERWVEQFTVTKSA